jgi:hypothetical protein
MPPNEFVVWYGKPVETGSAERQRVFNAFLVTEREFIRGLSFCTLASLVAVATLPSDAAE